VNGSLWHAYTALRAFEVVVLERILAAAVGLIQLIRTLAYDPWELEEMLFIVVWVAAVVPVCRALHRGLWALRRAPAPPFERSALGVAATPLKAMALPFWALWFFDNGIQLAQHAGVEVNRAASPLLAGTPSAVYILWAGYAALHVQSAWFAGAAHSRGEAALAALGVRPTLQRVLALFTMVITLACASAAIGADPKVRAPEMAIAARLRELTQARCPFFCLRRHCSASAVCSASHLLLQSRTFWAIFSLESVWPSSARLLKATRSRSALPTCSAAQPAL
jgi:hypothetical protein